jgi:hypothetical protein
MLAHYVFKHPTSNGPGYGKGQYALAEIGMCGRCASGAQMPQTRRCDSKQKLLYRMR